MSAPAPTAARMILTLGAFGLASGAAISAAYTFTLPTIRRNQAEALERAVLRVLPGATSRRALVVRDGRLVPWDSAEPPPPDAVFAGHDGERLVGYAVPAEGPGFQDTIRLLYGLDPRRLRIIGLEILESRETPGLGDKIFKDAQWLACFKDLGVEPQVVGVKEAPAAPNEVDMISGATVSSKAVISIVNAANARWLRLLVPPDVSVPAPEAPR